MAYSGTVGTTVVTVQSLIDHGARRCGKLAEELTSEQLVASRESLFFLLSNLINIGIQYWAISKKVYGLNANKYIYSLRRVPESMLTPSDAITFFLSTLGSMALMVSLKAKLKAWVGK